jgi:tRNA(Ile)-lysidine synthase
VLERIGEHLRDSGLIPEGAKVLVGYSGGADSTCLLHLLHRLGYDVVAGHLHHGQRAEADKEMRLCEAFCEELGIPFAGGKADVPRMAKDLKIGLEEAGRKLRYEFLSQAAWRLGYDLIATAHTRDDHVETVLLNLTRGTGLVGLAGIPPVRGNIVRPLLPFAREETRAYCAEHGLWFHDDPANEDTAFSRSRIRQAVLPELRQINPAIDESVLRMAATVREEDAFLDALGAGALERSEVEVNGNLKFLTEDVELFLDRKSLSHLPKPLMRRALRLAVRAMGAELAYDHVQKVEHALNAGDKHGSVTADGGRVVVEWDDERLVVRNLEEVEPFRYNLTVPGETMSDDFGWQFTVFATSPEDHRRERGALEVVIDSEKVKGQLHFRSAKAGDTIKPLNFEGTKDLADILSEAGLTRAARSRLPIVCDMVGPVWAPGQVLADRVKIEADTRNALLLRFGPLSEGSQS